jgi:hypothetical protein
VLQGSTVGSNTGLFEHFKGKSDYEIVYEEINQSSSKITVLTLEQWNAVQARKKREELIEVAKSGSWTAIASFLATFGDEVGGP